MQNGAKGTLNKELGMKRKTEKMFHAQCSTINAQVKKVPEAFIKHFRPWAPLSL
jgi:hypothetical protein